jgi:hypothetical protein
VALPREIESAGSASVFTEIEIDDDDPYWVVSAKGVAGYVQVGVSGRKFIESAGELRRLLITAAPLLALLAGAIGWWVAHRSRLGSL